MEKTFLFSVDSKSVVCGFIPSFALRPFLFVANVFMTPWLLGLHFVKIYAFPAVASMLIKLVEKFICALNIFSCGYTDIDFPPNDNSIGNTEVRQHTIKNLDCWYRGLVYLLTSPCSDFCCVNEVEWLRAADLDGMIDVEAGEGQSKAEPVKLFSGRIEPNDIAQGSLGDCWLLASIACVVERHEDIIKTIFLTGTASACGYYRIRLYDVFNGPPAWRCFTVDDWIPVRKGTNTPMYTRPNGNELWVMLLEKAFAKMMGSYNALQGGFGRIPLRAMTGNAPVEFVITGKGEKTRITGGNNPGVKNVPDLNYQEAWHVFQGSLQHNMIACAGTQSKEGEIEAKEANGLVSGHMYSILDTCTTTDARGKTVKLIKLRNPWGSHEWSGAYSEKDESTRGWKPNGGFLIGSIFQSTQPVKDDGIFWMPFNDFLQTFDYFCLCAVSTNMSSLHLDMHEDYGPCGPVAGCMQGGLTYCLMCQGAKHLWCPTNASTIDLIYSFKNGSLTERIGQCCDATARATMGVIVPDMGVAQKEEGDLF